MDELLKLVDMNHQLACDIETDGCGYQNYIHHLLLSAPHVFTTGNRPFSSGKMDTWFQLLLVWVMNLFSMRRYPTARENLSDLCLAFLVASPNCYKFSVL